MSDAERNALGITLAGKNQYRVLAAIMQNYAHAVEATEDAVNSEGTAQQQNDAYMESLEARVTRIKALFQELSNMVVGSDLVGGFIDLAEGILTFANTDFGAFVTQVGLLFTAMSGIYGMLSAGILGGKIPVLQEALPYIAAAALAFAGLYEVIQMVKKNLAEKAEVKVFDNVADRINESEKKIKEYDEKIDEAVLALLDLKTIPAADRTPEIDAEISRLEALISAYKKLKQVEEERLRTQYIKELRGTEFKDNVFIDTNNPAFEFQTSFLYQQAVQDADVVKALSKTYDTYEDAVWSAAEALSKYDLQLAEAIVYEQDLDTVSKILADRGVEFKYNTHTWTEELGMQLDALRENEKQYASGVLTQNDFIVKTKQLINENKRYAESLKTVRDAGTPLSKEEEEYLAIYDRLNKELIEAQVGTNKLAEAEEAINRVKKEHDGKGEAATLKDYVEALSSIEGIDASGLQKILEYFQELGTIDIENLDEELQEAVKEASDALNSAGQGVTIPVDADTEPMSEDLIALEQEFEGQGITITSSADASALQESLQAVSQLIDTLNTKTLHVKVDSNVSEVMQSLNSLTSTINSLPSGSFSVYLNDYASSKLNSIYATYSKLKDKTITITTVYKQEGSGSGSAYAEGTDYFRGGQALINDGQPVNGSAAELVVANGKASIYNQGEPAIVNLPVGAKIYTAEETQDILHNIQSLKDSIPAFADGNVREPATINAETIQYDPSEYYSLNLPATITTPAAFEAWLKEKKHLLELDLITQEQYYLDLEYMNENYLKNMYNTQDDYWQYQEEVYKWKKEQVGDENALLKKQIELEKALGEVAKAKAQKILVFKNGKFQYIADTDAIDQAQKNLLQVQGKAYADGTLHATKGIHLVGEEGPELRVLNDGDGIIPANATKNLLDIAKMGAKGVADTVNKTLQTIYNFDISNLNLPNVKNADEFFDGLKNYAYQYSYA